MGRQGKILAATLLIAMMLMLVAKYARADDLFVYTGVDIGCTASYPTIGLSLRNWVAERDFFNSMAFGLGYVFQSVEIGTNLDSFNYPGNLQPKDRRLFLGLAHSLDFLDAQWLELSIGVDSPFGHMSALEAYLSLNISLPLALDL
jgi:hypothetical protein